MEFSLGVSMTPTAVRCVLVEGATADGATIDHFDLAVGDDAAEQVVAAILGTRESVEDGGHRLVTIGVAWTDHGAAAQLRQALRAHGGDSLSNSVVLVSQLHAASALAQAIGRAVGYERTALMFLDGGTATLAVVRTADGAVVRVNTRALAAGDPAVGDAVQEIVGRLDGQGDPPQALYLVGNGTEALRLRGVIAEHATLPVHAPHDAELALARGAALASASTPRWEAETIASTAVPEQTSTQAAVGLTQRAGASYMAPLGYSAVADDPEDLEFQASDLASAELFDDESSEAEPKSFFLVGSALATLFVVGMVALVISLTVTIRPAVQQLPAQDPDPVANSQAPAPGTAPGSATGASSPSVPETIQAPIPVAREAPRTVYVTPAPVQVPVPMQVEAQPAPAVAPPPPPAPAPVPAPVPPPAPAPVAAPVPPPAPAPVPVPVPVAVPVPVPVAVPAVPSWLPQLPTAPVRRPHPTPPAYSSSAPASPPTPAVTPAPALPAAPAAPVTPEPSAPAADSSESGSGTSQSAPSQTSPTQTAPAQNPLWPLWPFGR